MTDSRVSYSQSESSHFLPKKEQWSIIYQHKAMELEKAKSLEKLMNLQKKQTLKRQLDDQINSKNSVGANQKQEDKKYYDFITKRAQELKEKEQRDKNEKTVRRKIIEEQNQHALYGMTDPKAEDFGKIYNIQIGLKSERDRRNREESGKRQMVQMLDEQTKLKNQQRQFQKQKDSQERQKNETYQIDAFNNRNANAKKYEQNPMIYNYYRQLNNQQMRRQRELQHKMVDEVKQKLDEEDLRRKQNQEEKKRQKSLQLRDTLDQQVMLLHYKKAQESRPNPEQVSYSVMGNIFREKRSQYDKRQYSLYLQKQAEQQRNKKMHQGYMSEQQYKLNLNQLNLAVNGSYVHDKYQDRSLISMGEKVNASQMNSLQHEDSDIVKMKLENLKNKRRTVMNSNGEDNGDPLIY